MPIMNKPCNSTELFLKLSTSMLVYDNIDTYLQDSLLEVGKVLNVHRVYVFTFEGMNWRNIFSWVDPTLPPFTDLLDGNSLQQAFYKDGMLDYLNAGRPYVMKTDSFADENAKRILASQLIKEFVMVPLFSNGKLSAFFGVDQCENVHGWLDDILGTIQTIGLLLNNAIHYFDSIDFLNKKDQEAQELLDILPFWVYIIDPETYQMICYNKVLGDYANIDSMKNEKCYKILSDLDEPCPFCKIKQLGNEDKCLEWDYYSEKFKADFRIFSSILPWGNIENACLTIAIDISDSLRMQRDQVLERESFMAKSRFLANMSHELRTPLNGIIGMLHLAQKNNIDVRVGEYLGKIKESSANLLDTINDILDFSKMEAGKLELEQRPFNPRDIFKEIKQNLTEEAINRGVILEYYIDNSVPKLLIGDGLRVAQVLSQLLKNAIKFTENGEVKFSLNLHDSQLDKNSVLLSLVVQDTGIGISEEDVKSLFVGFSQADNSSTRRYGGAGIGLAIVEKLVKLMSGNIDVSSVLGQGTKFTCDIPFAVASDNAIVEYIEEDFNMDLTNVSVLLAEDNEINTIIAEEMLKQMGCKVDCVQNGQEVLDILEKNSYDIILMDVQMPQMDGLEATKLIRENTRFEQLPIIALTAHILNEEIDKCYTAGMQGHVHKPISMQALSKAMIEQLRAKI